MSTCVSCLADEGFEAEIASYTYSDEYLNSFGIDSVPYARTATSVVGESTVAYQRNQAMDPGFAGFDANQGFDAAGEPGLFDQPHGSWHQEKWLATGGSNRFTITWTSRVQLGVRRRSAQRSVVSSSPRKPSQPSRASRLSGRNILSIANA